MTQGRAYRVVSDSVDHPEVLGLIEEHVQNMRDVSPPESTHVLPLDELRAADVNCWSMWFDDSLAGVAALKALSGSLGEVKSMRTAQQYLRQGVAAVLLETLIAEARSRGYQSLYLETGSNAAFEPARALYERYGFVYCAPFADYIEDPNSVFMHLKLINQ